MSLLRALPSLTAPIARRTYTATFSSSACACAEGASVDIIDALIEGVASSSSPATPGQTSETPKPADDRPPPPPEGSYPPRPNPVREAKNTSRNTDEKWYSVYVKASRNNTIVTFARPKGNQLVTLSGGKLGFKKSNRNGYEAGYQCAVGIIQAMETEMSRLDKFEWQLYLNGFGQGRDAMLTAITTAVGEKVQDKLKRVTDRTPIKIGGTRGKKARRV